MDHHGLVDDDSGCTGQNDFSGHDVGEQLSCAIGDSIGTICGREELHLEQDQYGECHPRLCGMGFIDGLDSDNRSRLSW